MPADPKSRPDRTVHATLRGRAELVRYGRSGRWYVESATSSARTGIGVRYAAAVADVMEEDGGKVFYRAGGDRMLAARSQIGVADRSYARTDLLAPYGIAKQSPAELVNYGRASAMSPQSLRDFIAENGGTVVRESDYRYTPEQNGDGESGHYTITFADRHGKTVGEVGFSRFRSSSGEVFFSAVDFHDRREESYRYDDSRGGWIHKRHRGFVSMLASMITA